MATSSRVCAGLNLPVGFASLQAQPRTSFDHQIPPRARTLTCHDRRVADPLQFDPMTTIACQRVVGTELDEGPDVDRTHPRSASSSSPMKPRDSRFMLGRRPAWMAGALSCDFS